jgi:uncharacterized SAM-binding protein YcdF (DUF218 family)
VQSIIDLFKTSLRPNSVFGCLLLVLVGVLLLRGHGRWGRRWLVAVLVGYWAIATPLVAQFLASAISGSYTMIESPAEVPGESAIVVLSGGAFTYRAAGMSLDVPSNETAFRLLEAVRLYRLLGDQTVIVSGGTVFPETGSDAETAAMDRSLVDLGIPPQRIVNESNSRNTEEEAAQLKVLLEARHIDRFVLITSPMHMRRSLGVFRSFGLRPYVSISRITSEGLPQGPPLLPGESSLRASDQAIYEYGALVYYWVRGRL